MKTDLIPTKQHAYIDYLTAGSLLTLPFLFSGKNRGAETYIPVIMGAVVLGQSLLTGYEQGAKKGMKMKTHLQLDYLGGSLLALSPFIFGFRKKSWAPHLAMGLSELAIAYFTKEKPRRKLFGIFG